MFKTLSAAFDEVRKSACLKLIAPLKYGRTVVCPSCCLHDGEIWYVHVCVLGMAGEFRSKGVAFNALWPRTAIATAAVKNILGGDEGMRRSRKPEIMADAAYWVLTQPSKAVSGNFFIDDEVLAQAGVTDLDQYAVDPEADLIPDFFV